MIAQTANSGAKIETIPFMTTLSDRLNKAMKDGYTANMKMTKQGLYVEAKDKTYTPKEEKIFAFYLFEAQSAPADNSIMYVVETTDGVKGTLVDAYGAYADENVNKFMTEVQEINKKAVDKHAA